MDSRRFVSNWLALRKELLATLTDPAGTSEVAQRLRSLNLPPSESAAVLEVIDLVLRDSMYTLLLALDGEASLGGDQQRFVILDEQGQRISDLEAEAWRQFHGHGA